MNAVLSAASPLCLGVVCIIFGLNLRTGRGKARVSRGVGVSYAQVPLAVRIRASNANLVMGLAWLTLGVCGLFPSPLVLVPMAFLLLSVRPYYSRHKDLQVAAKEVAEARAAD